MRAWLGSLDPRWSFELAGGFLMAFAERLPAAQLLAAEEMAFAFLGRTPPGLLDAS